MKSVFQLRLVIVFLFFMFSNGMVLYAQQTPEGLSKEAKLLERKFKEEEAINKYGEVLIIQPTNMNALVKISELWGNIGMRAATVGDLFQRNISLKKANEFANKALALDSNSAEALHAKALLSKHFAQTEEKKDLATENLRLWKEYVEKSLAANPQNPFAMHLLAQWHLTVLTKDGLNKAAAKILFGGLSNGDLPKAIILMETCADIEPYYAPNFYDLGRAYELNKEHKKAIETLERLAKLPSRRQDDATIKGEGAAYLQTLQ